MSIHFIRFYHKHGFSSRTLAWSTSVTLVVFYSVLFAKVDVQKSRLWQLDEFWKNIGMTLSIHNDPEVTNLMTLCGLEAEYQTVDPLTMPSRI